MPATFTVKQVADILGYSTNSIYTFLKAKRIKGVRVGKGRFRIPQSEIDRLLLVKSGTPGSINSPRSSVVLSEKPYLASAPIVSDGSFLRTTDEFIDPIEHAVRIEVPSLFDWFVGVGSIILGFAMFLFSKSYEEFAVSSAVSWVFMMRSIFIAGGFGLLLSDMSGKKSVVWSRIFRFVLLCAFSVYASVSIYGGNTDVGLLFGLMVPLLAVSFGSYFKGVTLFLVYSIATTTYLSFVLVILRSPIASLVFPYSSNTDRNIFFGILGILIVSFLYTVLRRFPKVLPVVDYVLCAILICASFDYAKEMMWGRSLFLLMASVFTAFIPLWMTLTFTHKRDRSFVFGVIGSLLVLFLFVIGGIHIMQTNMLEVASSDLDNKVVYGKVSVETTLESAKSTLISLASNPLLIQALVSEKTSMLVDVSKAVVGVNTSLRKVTIASPDGVVLSSYPLTETQTGSIKDSDYFRRAIAGTKLVVSDEFENVTNISQRKVIILAVPVLSIKGTVIGVVAGSLDLDSLGVKLQQLSSEVTGEYAMLIDAKARYIVHPDPSLVGSLADGKDPIRIGLAGKRGVIEGFPVDGESTITAVDVVNDLSGWAIAIRVPMSAVFRMRETSVVVLILLLGVSAFIMAIFFSSHRKRTNILNYDSYTVPRGRSS